MQSQNLKPIFISLFAASFFFTIATFAQLKAGDTTKPALQMKKVLVRGVQLTYIEQGNGVPVVFVHGSLGDFNTFSPQFEAFAKHFHIVSYSRRFHPPNEWAKDDSTTYSASLHADDLAGMIEKLNLRKVHVVASSYGAYTALMLALKYPALVRSLVLGEPPAFPLIRNSAIGDSVYKAFEANALNPSRQAFEGGDLEDGLRQFIDGVRSQKGYFDQIPIEAKAGLMNYAQEIRLEMLTDRTLYFPQVSCGQLGRIKIPTLLVTGERSAKMFHLITDELDRCLPNKERIMIPNAGHSMHSENPAGNPAAYNEKIFEFLLKH